MIGRGWMRVWWLGQVRLEVSAYATLLFIQKNASLPHASDARPISDGLRNAHEVRLDLTSS